MEHVVSSAYIYRSIAHLGLRPDLTVTTYARIPLSSMLFCEKEAKEWQFHHIKLLNVIYGATGVLEGYPTVAV